MLVELDKTIRYVLTKTLRTRQRNGLDLQKTEAEAAERERERGVGGEDDQKNSNKNEETAASVHIQETYDYSHDDCYGGETALGCRLVCSYDEELRHHKFSVFKLFIITTHIQSFLF